MSGKCLLWDALREVSVGHLSGRESVRRRCVMSGKCPSGFVWSEKSPSGMCLVGEMSIGRFSGRENVRRGCVWLGKCPLGMCLVGEVSAGDVYSRGSVHQRYVWSGKCLLEMCPLGKSPSGKCPSGMCPGIGIFKEYIKQNFIMAVLKKANSHSVDIC